MIVSCEQLRLLGLENNWLTNDQLIQIFTKLKASPSIGQIGYLHLQGNCPDPDEAILGEIRQIIEMASALSEFYIYGKAGFTDINLDFKKNNIFKKFFKSKA